MTLKLSGTTGEQFNTPTFTPANPLLVAATGVNSYAQALLQNTSNGTGASTDFIVTNDSGTDSTGYGDFGINSSLYSGSGAFSDASGVYAYAQTGTMTIGTAGAQSLKLATNNVVNATLDTSGNFTTVGSVNAPNTFGFKNRIINGAMMIDQRNAGASKSCPASTVTYALDRWLVYPVGNAVAVQQVASGLSTGSPYALQATGASSVTNIIVAQRIESKNIADLVGQTVTVSVTMANSLLTTISWLAEYANSVDSFSNTTSIASGTITVNSTMTTYSFSFTVPANGANGVSISLTAGAQTSGTWKITQAQLEKGSTATSFDFRPYGTELALCQRYYWKTTPSTYNAFGSGVIKNATSVLLYVKYPAAMRANPTFSYSGTVSIGIANGATNVSALAAQYVGLDSARVDFTVSGQTAGQGAIGYTDSGSASNYVQADAEL